MKATRAAATANSFEAVARQWWEQVHRHRVPAHAGRNLRRLELHVLPAIGHLPIHEVTARQVLAALRQVERWADYLDELRDGAVVLGSWRREARAASTHRKG